MAFKKRIKIKNRWIGGENDPCFIIAEVGSNHNRNFKLAKKMVDTAKEAGADAVKFQTYLAESLYQKEKKPLKEIGDKEKPFDIIKKIELPRKWQKTLSEYADKKGLIFLSTPFDKQAIDELNEFVPAFKWASPELIDRPLLEYAAEKGKPMIISTGFYGLEEIKNSLKWVSKAGNNQVILLHCTGLYPTLLEEVNLRAIQTIKKLFKVPVGLSEHTLSTAVPALAVVLGAKVIEKHFTLNRKAKGPDHVFSLEPKELKEMIINIRNAEKALGSNLKKPAEREIEKEKLIRRGVVAVRKISKGDKISLISITTKRTGKGAVLPADMYKIIGKKTKRDIKVDQKIAPEDIL